MSADALQPVRDAYGAFNRGDIDEVLLHFDPDIEIVDSSRRVGTFRGHDAYREFVAEWLENWDEYRTEIQGLTQNGDRVLVDVLATGRGKGSGIELSEPVTHVITLRDGKISRFEVYPDRADAMRAAGLETARSGAMGDAMLELVKQVGEETASAFNRGDFEAALGYLPDDFEWHPPSEFPDSRVLHGPEEIVRFYHGLRAVFPDYRSENRDYRVVGDRTIIVHHRMSGTGGASGVEASADVFQVMELSEDGLPVRLREFLDRGQAEKAAGLRD